MLYELNLGEIDYYYDLFEKHAYMNKLIEYIDFDNSLNEELIRKCIYKKMYNPGKVVGKEYINQLPITKEQKKEFLIEFDRFFDAIFVKHKITFSKELLVGSIYVLIVLFYIRPINSFINSIINNYTGGYINSLLIYNHKFNTISISLGTFLFILLLFILLSYLVSKIEIRSNKKQ